MASTIPTADTKHCLLTIETALRLRQRLKQSRLPVPKFLCSYCKRPVKAESKGRTNAAHFEHLKRNLNCPLSEKSTAKRLYADHKAAEAKRRAATRP